MPIYVDKENGTMILRDYGEPVHLYGTMFGGRVDKELWAEVMGTLASVQLRTIGKTDDLLEAGFVDGRPEALLDRFEELLNHPELGVLEDLCESRLEDLPALGPISEYLGQLRTHAPHLKRKVKEISEDVMALNIPATVLHNDIGTNNVCREAETGKLKVIDWELAYIGHPFMD